MSLRDNIRKIGKELITISYRVKYVGGHPGWIVHQPAGCMMKLANEQLEVAGFGGTFSVPYDKILNTEVINPQGRIGAGRFVAATITTGVIGAAWTILKKKWTTGLIIHVQAKDGTSIPIAFEVGKDVKVAQRMAMQIQQKANIGKEI